jgi:hypothetical protein
MKAAVAKTLGKIDLWLTLFFFQGSMKLDIVITSPFFVDASRSIAPATTLASNAVSVAGAKNV